MLPGVSLHTPARKRGLAALNALPDADSHDLVNAWAKLAKKNPAAVEKAIIKLGQQDAKKVAALRAAEREAAEELRPARGRRRARGGEQQAPRGRCQGPDDQGQADSREEAREGPRHDPRGSTAPRAADEETARGPAVGS